MGKGEQSALSLFLAATSETKIWEFGEQDLPDLYRKRGGGIRESGPNL